MNLPAQNSETVPMSHKALHRFYEPIILLKALNVEMKDAADFVDSDDAGHRRDPEEKFEAFVYKLAHVCDSVKGNQGGTITSVMVLEPHFAEGDIIEYRFASNGRTEDEAEVTSEFIRSLLGHLRIATFPNDEPAVRRCLLRHVLLFNRSRIASYLTAILTEVQRSLDKCLIAHDDDEDLLTICMMQGNTIATTLRTILALLEFNWGNVPIPRPIRSKSMKAEGIVGRMTSDTEVIEVFRGFARDLQLQNLDARIETESTKNTFRPIVHSEILLLDNLEKRGPITPERFFHGWMYIGSSKPLCRLCQYYFDMHRSGVKHRKSHLNLYTSWRLPDVLRSQGAKGVERRQNMINRMTERVRHDVFDLIQKRVQPMHRNHDSFTSSVRFTLDGRWAMASTASDVASQMESLALEDYEDDEQGGVALAKTDI
ncbi:uncharacterized protein GLRG_01108 [Colletotrichum graminicola M1.001]|uniref:Uncharacterized protein n=1 Tax=Colletotrichum graminicola (strain M1.001 / M2 / FGSC 10212) TaxID=645133 RepID=E3Q5J7_COLGM|nr:uncharacterized protein GLRG_01108 [Colletotrichum graminicola M1.001]EFQ25964.1 hypothetical protein GLRG_01108 [Colletotrichum graminicola M1.001]